VNPFGHNYPAGAEHDPSAPWNQPAVCRGCGGVGTCHESYGEPFDCPDCNGTGRQKTRAELRQEWLEDKADMEREDE